MPGESVTFTVSGPPVAKSRARSGGQGRHYTPEHTKKYEAHTRLAAQIAMGERLPMKGAVEMLIVAVLPIRQSWSKPKRIRAAAGTIWPTTRPDIDNYLKIIADACNGIVYDDDSQIASVRATKVFGDRPRMDVTVEVIPEIT